MLNKDVSKILELTIAQRLMIVDQIWESIVKHPEAIPLPDSRKDELENRLNSYYANPQVGSPWQEVKQRILAGN